MPLKKKCLWTLVLACCLPNLWLSAQTPPSSKRECADALEKLEPSIHIAAPALRKPATGGRAHYQIATIQFRQDNIDSHYGLYLGKSVSPAYEGNDLAAMVRHLNTASPLPNGGSYYVSFDGFEPHRAENLVQTVRLQMDSVDSSISVVPIAGNTNEWKGLTLQSIKEVRGEAQISEMAGRPGWFEGTQEIVQIARDGLHHASLRIQAKSRLLIQSFFDLFRDKVKAAASPASLAEIVSSTRAEIKRKLDLNDAEFRAVVLDQTGRIFIVRLLTRRYVG